MIIPWCEWASWGLRKARDVLVVEETGEALQVECLTGEARPDVLALDLNMPGLDPLAFTRLPTEAPPEPSSRILVLTALDDKVLETGLLAEGAADHAPKTKPSEDI